MIKYISIKLDRKKNQTFCIVEFPSIESSNTATFDVKWTKSSNQPINEQLSHCIDRMVPHLLFASEFIDSSIKLDVDMDYEKWFKEFEWQKEGLQQDNRFDNVDIDKIEFIQGKDGNLSGINIFGHKVAVNRSKPIKNTFKTGVVRLDKEEDIYYPLVVLLDEQIQEMILAIDAWLESGRQLKSGTQLKIA